MIWKHGNIWVWYKLGHTVVIPTNAGWKSNGENVMGAGLAKDAVRLVPDLPVVYGADCQARLPWQYYPEWRLICVPSKPLNEGQPHLSWMGTADPATVQDSLRWLQENAQCFPSVVYVPIIGSGNGSLSAELVQAYMEDVLKDERFVGVTWETGGLV
jgi:hypothetical protein